ncbi:unnamed protein product [Gulo gulo]|uniref:Uncharacterized protein n=1 Tax=Gulo gulo TaxID=48420 RepID=A0A9X9M004_GULGU|nr:unnamed protein product [Gulo gulo]
MRSHFSRSKVIFSRSDGKLLPQDLDWKPNLDFGSSVAPAPPHGLPGSARVLLVRPAICEHLPSIQPNTQGTIQEAFTPVGEKKRLGSFPGW